MKFHTHSSKLIGLLVLWAMAFAFSPAMAQDLPAEIDEDIGAGGEEAQELEQEDSELEGLDPDDPDYWAKSRDIYTVQKRPFLKEGRFSASLYGGIIPNNIFEQYFPAGLRLNYYVLENLGLELAGSYAFKLDTGLSDTVEDSSGIRGSSILIGDTQLSHTNLGVVWSPFYGKTSYYASALNYFDLHLFAGLGMVITETQEDFNAPAQMEIKPEGALGAGVSVYLNQNLTMRADFRQFVFQKVGRQGGVAKASEGSLGIGWFF